MIKKIDAVAIQAGISAILSFTHLHDLAVLAGQDEWMAWLYPISVDLLMYAAYRRLRAGHGRVAAWFWFIVALAASLAANVVASLHLDAAPQELKVIIGAWTAIALLGGMLLSHSPKTESQAPAPFDFAHALGDHAYTLGATLTPQQPPAVDFANAVNTDAETLAKALEDPVPEPEPEPAPQAPKLVTIAAAAEMLGVSASTVRGWYHGGKLTDHGYEGRSRLVDLNECQLLAQ